MITELKSNEVFVFGSNLHGIHAGGAARQAKDFFGAIEGKGVGIQGQSYAIPTLDGNFQKLPLNIIKLYVRDMFDYALSYPNDIFYLTAIGTGIAGYSKEEMETAIPKAVPSNVIRV